MTFEIRISQFWDGADQIAFENAVQDYINTLHAFNMVVGKPRPAAIHPLVERAIKRIQEPGRPDRYVADYEIIDDTPPPPSLEDKKNKLMSELRQAESVSMNEILPHRKVRLLNLKHAAAVAVDETERTIQHNEDIAHMANIKEIYDRFSLIAAQAESDIEDLTEQTIANWHLPTFG